MEELLKEVLLCENDKYLLCYHRGKLIIRKSEDYNIVKTFHLHGGIRSIPIVERLLRLVPRTAVSISKDDFIFSHDGKIYRYTVNNNALCIEHYFINGMKNPIVFNAEYNDDGEIVDLLYGEYFWNEEKGPVSIYRRRESHWNKVYTFPPHTIQHIHNIIYDKFKKRYLILTGDSDEESGIWEADVEFNKVTPILRGSQKYRACVLLTTNKDIFYITDTPLEYNYVYRLSIDNTIQEIAEISGPCIFGVEKGGSLYFATSVEGDPSLGGWKYRLSNKLGNGVKDRYSHLYKLSQDGVLKEITKMQKDFFPMWLFEFGNMKFPFSSNKNVYVCPQSLKAKYGTYVLKE